MIRTGARISFSHACVSSCPCTRRLTPGRNQKTLRATREPNVFHIQATRMPVAVEAARIVREEDQVGFEHADEHQDQEIDNDGEKVARETAVERFS